MKKFQTMTSSVTATLARFVILTAHLIGTAGLLDVAFAEEQQMPDGTGTMTDPGQVTERAVDTRDYRSSPQPQTAQQGPNSRYQIVAIDTNPENFKANMLIADFMVWVGCRPGFTIGSTDCPNRDGVTFEIWHTQSGQPPILLSIRQNLPLEGSMNYEREGVRIRSFRWHKVPGARLVNPGGFFTVKVVSRSLVLAERVFEVVPFEWTILNPARPPVVDHRRNR